ncbi:MAG: PAS domain S-box protein [Dehalococcoidia bacterium]|nr:PAS domain S-box protein [Dehalococcoidia bacterium]
MAPGKKASGGQASGGRPSSPSTSPELVDALLLGAPCPLALLGADERFLRVNRAFAATFGQEPDGFRGKAVAEALGGPWDLALRGAFAALTGPEPAPPIEVSTEDELTGRRFEATCYRLEGADGFGLALREVSPLAARTPGRALPAGPEPAATGRTPWPRVDAMPALVVEIAPDGTPVRFNERWFEYTGLEEAMSMAGGWRAALHPDDLPLATRVARGDPALGGDSWESEFRLRRADGVYRWHLARHVAERDETGAIVRWVGTAVDIDDRKRAEEAVERSEQRYRSLGETVAALVMETAEDGRALWCNGAYLEYSGLSAEEFLGYGWMQLVYPDDAAGFPASMTEVGESWTAEVRLRRADGQYRWHLGRVNRVANPVEETTWVCTAVDIHDRKVAEEALQRSEDVFRQLGDALPVLVSITGADTELRYLSKRWSEYTGLPPEELHEMKSNLALLHPDDRERAAAVRRPPASETEQRVEVRIRRYDGEYRWHWLQVVPVRGHRGDVRFWTGVAVDIHDRKLAEERLQRHTGQLRALAEAATAINSREAVGHVLAGLTKRARIMIGANAAITTVAQDGDWAHATSAISLADREASREPWEALAVDEEVVELVRAEDKSVRMTRAETEHHLAFARHKVGPAKVRGWLAAPLVGSDGRNLGLIQLTDRSEGEFDETDEAIVEQLARFAATTIEKSLLLEEVEGARIRLETVFEQMPAGVVIVDAATGEVVFSNRRGAQILPYAARGENYLDTMSRWRRTLHGAEVLPPDRWPITRALHGEVVRDEIHTFDRGDNELGMLSLSASPIHDESGNIVAGIVTFVDVTEQEAAREALRLSEDRYRTLTETIPLAVFTVDAMADCDYVNQGWLTYTGNAPGDDVNDGWKRSLHPDDVPQVDAVWDMAVETGGPVDVEYRLRRADGVYRWHLERAEPLRDPSGTLRGWIGHATDIHDQKLAAEREQLLAEVGRQLAMSLDLRETLERVAACAVPNLGDFCLVDVLAEDGSAQRVAAAHADPGQAEFVAMAMEIGPRTGTDNPVARVLRSGKPEVVFEPEGALEALLGDDEEARRHAEGAKVAGFMILPLRAHGNVLGAITFVNTDEARPLGPDQASLAEEIADQAALAMANARLFARTQETAAQLAASEERYRMLVEATPTNVSLIDPEGRTIFRNRTLQRYTGMGVSDTLPFEWLEKVHPDDWHEVRKGWDRAVATGEQGAFEFRLRGADDTYRWHLSERVPIVDADGVVTSWLVVSVDIDQVKQAQEALERANALKDEFLGLVSHELRTPLTGILGNAQILLRHWDRMDPEARAGSLDDIRGEAQRLQRLVENMLVLAGIEGRGEVATEPLLVQRVIPHIVKAHCARHPSREVRMDIDEDVSPVEASPTYFDQVLANLLSNAEKYSPSNALIDVTVRAGNGVVEVRVFDRGVGITDDEIDYIFRPFFRSARTAATAAGAGLGLAVCKRLLDAQGGRIWAAKREGGGTEFGFALPTDE